MEHVRLDRYERNIFVEMEVIDNIWRGGKRLDNAITYKEPNVLKETNRWVIGAYYEEYKNNRGTL